MELREFVTETLKQIIEGVKAAQVIAAEQGGTINPHRIWYRTDQGEVRIQDKDTGAIVQEVRFDVAVTTTEGKGGKSGIGVFVGSFGVGTQADQKSVNESISRIQFQVPISLPIAKVG